MSARRTLHRFFERRERQRRRQRMRRLVRRGVMGTLAVQTATAAGLFTFDSIRKKDRPEGAFPHRPAETVALPRSEVRVFMYGEELFEQMLEDIEAAQHRVFLETYIWKGDEMGQRFRDALVRADARGVEVYVVIDDFANLVVPASFKRSLPATVHAAAHPLVSGGWKFLHPRYSGRDHRKLLVVDSDIAYVGGFNIGSLYATKWRDTHARITGEFVVELENAFIDYWNVHARRGDEALGEGDPGPLGPGPVGDLAVALAPVLGLELGLEVVEEPVPPHGAQSSPVERLPTSDTHDLLSITIKQHQTASSDARGHRRGMSWIWGTSWMSA